MANKVEKWTIKKGLLFKLKETLRDEIMGFDPDDEEDVHLHPEVRLALNDRIMYVMDSEIEWLDVKIERATCDHDAELVKLEGWQHVEYGTTQKVCFKPQLDCVGHCKKCGQASTLF